MSHASREGFTVRVLRSGSATPAGIGFVVSDRHIVTCAHVVNTALGRKLREQDKPGRDARVQVDFPIIGGPEDAPLRNCRVEAWEPPPEYGVAGGDVAGLVLVGEKLPHGAGPARLVEPVSVRDIPVAVFGYPDSPHRTNGVWSAHRLRGAVGGGVIQLDRSLVPGAQIRGITGEIREALLNLVQNAYEAMQDGDHGGTLRVDVQPAVQNDREGVELRLTDTGPGVPEELREEIFNPFVTTKKTGVGLGLSIVSKIVDGHHGSIHVENAAGGGAVFTIFFPLGETVEPHATAEPRSAWTGEGARPHTS